MFTNTATSTDCHVCPWWVAYTFDNPLRRFFHRPATMFASYLKEGMTALDIGCGMGYFSIGMAKMVGDAGAVIAVDVQQEMLDILMKRAKRQGVAHRIRPHRCASDTIGAHPPVDFALTFWMAHEVPHQSAFFEQIYAALKPGGKFLIVEPRMHVTEAEFRRTEGVARETGFTLVESPPVRLSLAALFVK